MFKHRKKIEKFMAVVMIIVVVSMILALFGGTFITPK